MTNKYSSENYQTPTSNYLEVLLPLPLNTTFTYHIPTDINTTVGIGFRVIVPFGKKKFYTGIVTGILNNKQDNF